MPEPPPETLAWVRHAASCGKADAQLTLHILERLELLEAAQREAAMDELREASADLQPTPEAAPVATDEELFSAYPAPYGFAPALRAVYNLGRQHGAAAAQPAPVTTGEQWDALANRLWDQYATTGPGGNQFMLVGDFGTALELARQHGAAQPPAAQPAPPAPEAVGECPGCEGAPVAGNSPCAVCGRAAAQPAPPAAPAGGLVERVGEAMERHHVIGDIEGSWDAQARAAIREVAARLRENEFGYHAALSLEQEAGR